MQGGPYTVEEASAFERQPCSGDALRLRRWDDAANVPGLAVHDLGVVAAE